MLPESGEVLCEWRNTRMVEGLDAILMAVLVFVMLALIVIVLAGALPLLGISTGL
jgi:hypothetical protein